MSEFEIIKTDEVELDTEKINLTSISQKRPSIIDQLKEKTNDQDFQQRMNVASTLLLEIYRVLMGAFLVVFVPQKCGQEICSLTQNINREDGLAKTAIAFNTITMLTFLMLYFVEVKRENKLINYLEVNRFTPVDNESVGEALLKLAPEKKQTIWDYDDYYQKAGYISTGSFILNSVFSSIVIFSHYFDSKTITVLLTNLLFMGLKVSDVYSTVNTKKNVFYSAYLKNKVQFNDVDPDKIVVESLKIEELPDDIASIEEGKENKTVDEERKEELKEPLISEEEIKEPTLNIEIQTSDNNSSITEEEKPLVEIQLNEDTESKTPEECKEESLPEPVAVVESNAESIPESEPKTEDSKDELLGPEDLV
jgi:hypothetical protein